MKFQIGDLVVLKHTGSEGRITGVENHEMYRVLIDDVEIPVFTENLDHPYFDWFTKERDRKKKLKFVNAAQIPLEPESQKRKVVSGVFLAFFPTFNGDDASLVDKFKVYLINQDVSYLHFHYRLARGDKNEFKMQGHTLPFTNFYIHDVSMDLMHESPSFFLKIYNSQKPDARHIGSEEIKIRPKKLFEYIVRLQDGTDAFFQLPISIQAEIANSELKIDEIGKQKINQWDIKSQPKYQEEVDLHIEKLIPDFKGLSNAEIISIQMSKCERVIEQAITTGQTSITLIHGVGKGVLKEEIHQYLRSIPEVRYFISDWMPRYGFGATQVFF